uniref:HVA22-like protein n=1 Tax=viral metagenome TaxID=1070528 RepID=A0A6C0BIY0_9ZZZZ
MNTYLCPLTCHLLTLPYPIYATFKTIESPNKHAETQWLTFWIMWACTAIIQSMTHPILYWVPFYLEINVIFLWSLQIPQLHTHTTCKLYQTQLKPFLLCRQGMIDAWLLHCSQAITRWVLHQALYYVNPMHILDLFKKDKHHHHRKINTNTNMMGELNLIDLTIKFN